VDGRPLDDRKNIALHALAAHVGPLAALASRDFVDLVDEDDAALLHALHRYARDAVHVDELALFFLHQVIERLWPLHAALARAPLNDPGQHVLDVDVDFFDRRSGDDFERRKRALAHVDVDRPVIETAIAELLAELLARVLPRFLRRWHADARRPFVGLER